MRIGAFFRWIGLLALGVLMAACASQHGPGNARIPDGAKLTHRAVLIGKSNHDAVGTISVYQSDEPAVVVFEKNFLLNAAPGTTIALGRNGFREDTLISPLVRNTGRQSYAVPPHLEVRAFNEVWLWNPKTGKPVGIARLTQL